MAGFLIFIVLLALYFVPSMVAAERKHHNTSAIVVLNLFLGWTLVGWVVALVWANTATRSPAKAAAPVRFSAPSPTPSGSGPFCSKCGASLEADAAFCPKCGTKRDHVDVASGSTDL